MQTVTIYRHWFGAAVIGLAGALVLALLIYVSWALYPADDPTQYLIAFIAVVVAAATVVSLYVYGENIVVLSASGIEYRKYQGLFFSNTTDADWNTVQRIDAAETSIFSKSLHYGTLTVITAGVERPNLVMTYIPDVLLWKEYIDSNATMGAQA
jgi:hypothetical protein